jgi:hypothetical protein
MCPNYERHQRRYRRHRLLGLLPALVLVVGGLYLGLAQQGWLGLVISTVFLILSALMIATDRSSDQYGEPTEGSRSHLLHDPPLRPAEELPGCTSTANQEAEEQHGSPISQVAYTDTLVFGPTKP